MRSLLSVIFLILFTSLCSIAQSLKWVGVFGDTGWDIALGNAVDDAGNVYSTGYFTGTSDLDPGPGTYTVSTDPDVYALFILKLDADGNFVWAVTLGEDSYAEGHAIALDDDGNVYVTGSFQGTIDFDPGAGVTELYSYCSYSMFFLKLTTDGELVWVKNVTASCAFSYGFRVWSIAVDHAGNVLTTGYFNNEVDFDPGAGVATRYGAGNDVFIDKLDADGNFLWVKQIGYPYSSDEVGYDIATDNAGNVLVSGTFEGTIDFDPGTDISNLTSTGGDDIFVEKLDADGNFIWARAMGASGYDGGWGITADAEGNVITTGVFYYTVDFDPGAGTYNLVSAGGEDIFIQKLDADGNFIWAKRMGAGFEEEAWCVTTDAVNNIYTTGHYNNHTVDFDPGPGISNLTNAGLSDVFVQKLDADGNFIWAKGAGGAGYDDPRGVGVDTAGNVYVSGSYQESMDFDPDAGEYLLTSNGEYDAFVMKIKPAECEEIAIVIDSVADATCTAQGYASAYALYGEAPYQYSWNTVPPTLAATAHFPLAGTYTLTITDAQGCIKSTSLIINGPTSLAGIDMRSDLVTAGFAPGFNSDIWVNAYNDGCIPASGDLQLILSPVLSYNSADPVPDLISGDTLTWHYEHLVFDSLKRQPYISVTTSPDALIGDLVHLQTRVTDVDDVDTTNNIRDYENEIQGSFDPNDISVYPAGACDAGYITSEQLLTYTIRFQNTGTDSAVNIYILDSLPASLNKNTIHVVGNSHPMHTEILSGNVIKFVFDNIYLPDSAANEPESHGYVIYEIEPKSTVTSGTVIENAAAIYFDFNDAVLTNNVVSTVVDSVPVFHTEQNVQICEGESFTVGSHTYNAAGTYTDIIASVLGCDSTVTTTLSVGPVYSLSQSAEICAGESITVGTSVYTETGIYVDAFASVSGCDSTITTTLTVHPVYATSFIEEICTGEVFIFGGLTLSVAGTYSQVFTSASGCDSTVELTLLVNTVDASVTVADNILTANSEAAEYQWINCNDMSLIPGATEQAYAVQASGNYAVIITKNGCADTSACYAVIAEVIPDNTFAEHITVYPNPANTFFTIGSSENLQYNAYVQLMNATGETVKEAIFPSGTNSLVINTEDMQPGFYLINITDSEHTIIRKLILSR